MDRLIIDELRNTKALYQQNWDALEQLIAQWTPKAELTGAQIIKLEKKIRCLEDETEAILWSGYEIGRTLNATTA